MSLRAQEGTVLGGRYHLTAPIAAGGMGEVWQARDELLGRTVAVKVLRSELASDPGFLERFRTEARNSARLAHPAIATTYDYGESAGSAFLVMELVPGEPLSDLLAREGALPPRRAMRLLARAAEGLAAAHAAGLVHRDVKPGNLLVTPTGGVKITDFGIARAAAEAPLTATGQVMGTAAYLSPEQATGRRDLTPAADVYALGIVAHEMLAGSRPFTGESQVAIALAQVNDPPPPLPDRIPASARALVSACLAKNPLQRPHDAALVAQVATSIADGDDAGALAALRGESAASSPPTARGAAPDAGRTIVLPPGVPLGLPEDTTGPASAMPWDEPAAASSPTPTASARRAEGGGAATPAPAKRRSLTVPLLGLLAVLAVVVIALLVHSLSGSQQTPQDPPGSSPGSSSSSTPSLPSTTPSTTPSQSTPTETPTTETPTSATPTSTPSDTPTTPTATPSSPTATATTTPTPSRSPTAGSTASSTPTAPTTSVDAGTPGNG